MVSLLVLVGIVVVAAGMYAVIGNKGGWVGVPRLVPDDFARNDVAASNLLNMVVWALLVLAMIVLFGFAVYKLRGLTD
jgi:hypothetical protein